VLAAGAVLSRPGPAQPALLLPVFILTGLGIGCGETAESAAVAAMVPDQLRGSAFGLLAAVQAAGNLIASVVAGLLWTAVSPLAVCVFLGAAMIIAAAPITTAIRSRSQRPAET
jgi:predicted MFS family arabinose efflux permease